MITDNKGPYNNWVHHVETQSANHIVTLYHPESLLLPTFGENILTSQEEKLAYFTQLKKHPCRISTQTHHTLLIEDNTLVNSGTYTFHLEKDGKKIDHHARFSFVFTKKSADSPWLIKLHQSSLT